ncbi:hypothetical protein JT191_05580 [Helicobacter pylori]|nr:hypothetical protein [Helicobacter pylori]
MRQEHETATSFNQLKEITQIMQAQKASANLSRGTKGSYNANAFKTEQANNSNLRAKKSDETQKPGLENNQSNQKGGER